MRGSVKLFRRQFFRIPGITYWITSTHDSVIRDWHLSWSIFMMSQPWLNSLRFQQPNHPTPSHLSDSPRIVCTPKCIIARVLSGVSINIHHRMSTEAISGSNACVGTSTTPQITQDQRINPYFTSNIYSIAHNRSTVYLVNIPNPII